MRCLDLPAVPRRRRCRSCQLSVREAPLAHTTPAWSPTRTQTCTPCQLQQMGTWQQREAHRCTRSLLRRLRARHRVQAGLRALPVQQDHLPHELYDGALRARGGVCCAALLRISTCVQPYNPPPQCHPAVDRAQLVRGALHDGVCQVQVSAPTTVPSDCKLLPLEARTQLLAP